MRWPFSEPTLMSDPVASPGVYATAAAARGGSRIGREPPSDATPGPKAGLPAKAKAYGRYCKDQSKEHVKGDKGTPFSKCVTAMAKLANGSTKSPRAACKTESKKRVEGEKGTPFSKCVSAGAKLLKDKAA